MSQDAEHWLQPYQKRADDWACKQLDRIFDMLDDSIECQGYIDSMFAAYMRQFGRMWGNDPQDFLTRLTIVAYVTEEGELAFKWTFLDDLLGESDENEEGAPDWPTQRPTDGTDPDNPKQRPGGPVGKRIA